MLRQGCEQSCSDLPLELPLISRAVSLPERSLGRTRAVELRMESLTGAEPDYLPAH